jgi:protoporphyrinogen oxidase
VMLILEDRKLFDDNWIYVHDPGVKVGRIQNFKSWSPEMVPDPKYACYGMEYFCFEGDGLWSAPDSELLELAKCEIDQIGLARRRRSSTGALCGSRRRTPSTTRITPRTWTSSGRS